MTDRSSYVSVIGHVQLTCLQAMGSMQFTVSHWSECEKPYLNIASLVLQRLGDNGYTLDRVTSLVEGFGLKFDIISKAASQVDGPATLTTHFDAFLLKTILFKIIKHKKRNEWGNDSCLLIHFKHTALIITPKGGTE